jgi:hypothetical protein
MKIGMFIDHMYTYIFVFDDLALSSLVNDKNQKYMYFQFLKAKLRCRQKLINTNGLVLEISIDWYQIYSSGNLALMLKNQLKFLNIFDILNNFYT